MNIDARLKKDKKILKFSGVKWGVLPATVVAAILLSPEFALSDEIAAPRTNKWDMCRWEQIPEGVLEKIMLRGDFENILRRMFDSCPDSALGLTDRPTATISSGYSDGSRSTHNDEMTNQRPVRQPETETPEQESAAAAPPDYGLPG